MRILRPLMRRRMLVAALTLGVAGGGWAQGTPSGIRTDPEVGAALELLEAQFAADRKERKIPGLSAAVILDQEILWAKGFGYADLERQVPAGPQTIYRVGSITKLFTATMLMQLRDQGKLQLDDPLVKHLPAFHLASRSGDPSPVTLRQVVSHTAGLPTEAPLDSWQSLHFPGIDTVLASLDKTEMAFPPLTTWKYSNLGIALLGHALSRVAVQPYETYVRQHVLNPLGMQDSGFELTPNVKAKFATGYIRHREGRPTTIAPFVDIGGFRPAGSLYSTVLDIARFISLQFRAGNESAGGAQVLRGSSIREMHTVQWMNPDWRSGWGIGFELERVADRVAIGHAGGIHGFTTHIFFVPAEKIGVAVFANTNTSPEAFARSALELLIPVLQRVQRRMTPADTPSSPPPPDWQRYVGVYEQWMGDVEIRLTQNRLVLGSPMAPQAPGVSLAPDGPHRFRMKGGSASGDLLIFELDAAGNVTRVRVGPYAYDRRR